MVPGFIDETTPPPGEADEEVEEGVACGFRLRLFLSGEVAAEEGAEAEEGEEAEEGVACGFRLRLLLSGGGGVGSRLAEEPSSSPGEAAGEKVTRDFRLLRLFFSCGARFSESSEESAEFSVGVRRRFL